MPFVLIIVAREKAEDYIPWASGKHWSAETEVRKRKYGNRNTETEVWKWEEKPPIYVLHLTDSRLCLV